MPEIRESSGIVTQITMVKLPPDKQDQALDLMTERARFMATQPGFVSVSLHRSKDGSHVVNYLQWTDPKKLAGGASLAGVSQEVAGVRQDRRGNRALPLRGGSHRGRLEQRGREGYAQGRAALAFSS
jgi:hypothetical protein